MIVDITTTGSTLAANRLKVLDDGVILESEACLVQPRKRRPEDVARAVEEIRDRLGSVVEG